MDGAAKEHGAAIDDALVPRLRALVDRALLGPRHHFAA
jgi:hypothetical protein